ncbi:MAG: ATP synthase F1 subunit epsilon [Bacteroidetes bacterium]|nr:MAG: ATP synthase F1 subunit epsilon [Bacteroidota bacterium]
MHLEILAPSGKIFEGEVTSVVFPGESGMFGVMKNHAPLISVLKEGTIEWDINGKREHLKITGGVVEILNNKASVLVK